MQLLVEVEVKDSLPVNGTWKVPSLSAVDLIPVVYWLGRCDVGAGSKIDWIEESIFRATRNEDGIKLEFPVTADFDLLRFCMMRVIESMIRAVLDTAWGMEVMKRMKGSGIVAPQTQIKGPLRL